MATAKANFQDCQSQCQSDYQSAKLVCRNINPGCGLGCLAGRQACFDTVNQVLQTGQLPDGSTLADCSGGTDACAATYQSTVAACPDISCSGQQCTCQPTDSTCNDCVDQAQVADFECRDACRDSFRTNQTVVSMKKACNSGFTSCVHACRNPTPTPTP
jgi:hypothetical protein